MFEKFRDIIANDNELSSESLRFLSLIFLVVCASLSFFSYTKTGFFWNTTLTFTPGMISSILAILIIAPLYIRNILKWNNSIYTIISFVLILLVFASFIELATGGNRTGSLFDNTIVSYLIIPAIVLSWLGIKGVAGCAWILALAAAIIAAVENNQAIGFWGFIYMVSGTLGLVLHSGLNPGYLIVSLKNEYFLESQIDTHINHIRNEINDISQLSRNRESDRVLPNRNIR